jgi:uncharacterized protein
MVDQASALSLPQPESTGTDMNRLTAAFRKLHTESKPLCLANAWDAGNARLIESSSASAIADIRWIAPPCVATALALGKPAGFEDRDSMMDFICDDFARLFVKDVTIEVRSIVGEGDVVIVEQTLGAALCNGKPYKNDYVFVFEVRHRRVQQIREYMDTASAHSQMFGDGPARRLV